MTGPALYDRIGHGYPTTRRPDPAILAALTAAIRPTCQGRYLDLGCGTGNYTRRLAEHGGDWVGLDASQVMLDQACLVSSSVHWQRGDAANLPFADAQFDAVVSTLTIHHFAGLDGPMCEVRRVLRDGPFVLFTAFPDQMRDYWLCHYFPGMMQRSSLKMPERDRVLTSLTRAGFASIEVKPFDVTPLLEDMFLYSGRQRPRLYLDPAVRANISSFATLCEPGELAQGLAALERDLNTGAFEAVAARYGSPSGDYAFVVARPDNTGDSQ